METIIVSGKSGTSQSAFSEARVPSNVSPTVALVCLPQEKLSTCEEFLVRTGLKVEHFPQGLELTDKSKFSIVFVDRERGVGVKGVAHMPVDDLGDFGRSTSLFGRRDGVAKELSLLWAVRNNADVNGITGSRDHPSGASELR